VSKASDKLREKRREAARDRAATNPSPAPGNLTLEEAAAKAARLERELERQRNQTKQLLESERVKAKKAEQRAAQVEADRARERLRAQVVKSAQTLGAMDPEETADLLLLRHKFAPSPDGKLVREDDATVDLDGTIKTYLEARPWAARSTVASGTGTTPTAKTTGPTAAPRKSFREDPNAALRELVERETAQPPPSGQQR